MVTLGSITLIDPRMTFFAGENDLKSRNYVYFVEK